MEKKEKIIIIGAGPAGLAAGLKLTENKKNIIIFERDKQVGGISKTKEYNGFRFDLGGHRFFTKSKEVNKLWEETLGEDFLERDRLSRIYYKEKFFDYPLTPFNALSNLGILESVFIILSYTKSKISPYKEEKTFEQWVSNRFGNRLFNHFFKSYTEKVWGIPCNKIQAEWASQRIKDLSLISAIKNSFQKRKNKDIKTLIKKFKYPKYGPGMMYEKIAENIKKKQGKINLNHEVIQINHEKRNIKNLIVENDRKKIKFSSSYLISTMPITDLIFRLNPKPPEEILNAAKSLKYRSLITTNIILKSNEPFKDLWVYINSPRVKLGRIQNFIRWSPHMVNKKGCIALGLEYFCTEGDDFWKTDNQKIIQLALNEIESLKLVKKSDFIEGFVIRVPKAYPVYDESYLNNLSIIKNYLKKFKNLQTIGRGGMFRYNNMDHSILTGIYSAQNLTGGENNIWKINEEQDYYEDV